MTIRAQLEEEIPTIHHKLPKEAHMVPNSEFQEISSMPSSFSNQKTKLRKGKVIMAQKLALVKINLLSAFSKR